MSLPLSSRTLSYLASIDTLNDVESEASSVVSMDISTASSRAARSAESATSYDADSSMRSASPVSVISVNSTMQFYKVEYGRLLNNYSDIYQLPADEEELARLDKQHGILADIMGYKYVPGMAEVLADIPGQRRKTCLDLGCGAGSWVIDVANDFPHCAAVAVDLVPMQESIMPRNLRSEVDDINFGLEHFYYSFDVAHTRLIAAGIRDYHFLIDQLARVVKPGGLIDLSEYDFQTYNDLGQVIPVYADNFSPPWYARWLWHLREAINDRGGDIHAATHLYSWVGYNSAFEGVVYQEHFLPVVPPPREGSEPESLLNIDEGMRSVVMSFVGAGRPLLLGLGLPENYLSDLEGRVAVEIQERKIRQFTRLQCVYARRTLAEIN